MEADEIIEKRVKLLYFVGKKCSLVWEKITELCCFIDELWIVDIFIYLTVANFHYFVCEKFIKNYRC